MAKEKNDAIAVSTNLNLDKPRESVGLSTMADLARLIQNVEGASVNLTIPLAEGESFCGLYLGPGGDIEFAPDPKTGEIRFGKTWHFRPVLVSPDGAFTPNPKLTVNIVGSAQLNQNMAGFKAGAVIGLSKLPGKAKSSRGMPVAQWLVATIVPAKG